MFKLTANRVMAMTVTLCVIGSHLGCSSDRRDWDAATQEGSIASYERYLELHADGEFANQARHEIETLFFSAAEGVNSAAAYDDYLERYPEGEYAERARAKIDELFPFFSVDAALEIPTISGMVGQGSVEFVAGGEPNTLTMNLLRPTKVRTAGGKMCLFCVRTIHLAANLEVPADLFVEKSASELEGYVWGGGTIRQNLKLETVTVGGREIRRMATPPVVESVELHGGIQTIPVEPAAVPCLVSGPDGAILVKEGRGFRLVEGEARLMLVR